MRDYIESSLLRTYIDQMRQSLQETRVTLLIMYPVFLAQATHQVSLRYSTGYAIVND